MITLQERQATSDPLIRPSEGASSQSCGEMKVRVRMYGHGLGDCLLLSFLPLSENTDQRSFHMLIDCGVILGTQNAQATLKDVVENIRSETKGKLDVVVVTHQHFDHVSGFSLAKNLFWHPNEEDELKAKKLVVDEVWFAWTENEGDGDAKALYEARKARIEALSGLLARVNSMNMNASDLPQTTTLALSFFGLDEGGRSCDENGKPIEKAATPESGKNRQQAKSRQVPVTTYGAMREVRSFVLPTKIRYLGPQEVVNVLPDVRVYVLGPPRDRKQLNKLTSKADVYHLGSEHLVDNIRLATGDIDNAGRDGFAPFEKAWTDPLFVTAGNVEGDPTAEFLADRYFGPPNASDSLDVSWRRIDGAWLSSAEMMSIALDNATNNTSLVLAVELVNSGQVLLFPADAQVGSWLSWQSLEWEVDGRHVTTDDLLSRVKFLKVAHHGSVNATPNRAGLEKMQEPGMVAFIPVDSEMARQKRWEHMPFESILKRLANCCGSNVVRSDQPLPDGVDSDSIEAGPQTARGGHEYYDWSMKIPARTTPSR